MLWEIASKLTIFVIQLAEKPLANFFISLQDTHRKMGSILSFFHQDDSTASRWTATEN